MSFHQRENSLSKRTYNMFIYNNYHFGPHFHRNIEFIYVIDGELNVTLDTRTETVTKGRFVIIPPMSLHSFDTTSHSKAWIGVFSNDYVSEFCSFITNKIGKNLSFKTTNPEQIENYISQLDDSNTFKIKSFLYAICGEYTDKTEFSNTDVKRNDIFQQAIEYVNDHYLEDITLASIAAALSYEPHYISRCFHEHTEENFRSIVNTYRIEHAKRLIVKGELNIGEIATQSGFKCIRSFNRVFKETTGTEPKKYLKLALQNEITTYHPLNREIQGLISTDAQKHTEETSNNTFLWT